MPGQAVEVTLSAASDTTLTAREVDQEGEDDGIEIEAPIQQAVDQTIQILGLSVDVSQASFGGSRDDDNEDSDQPVSQTDLMTGQFVKLKLPSSTPPFVASQVRGENFSNQVEVEVDDSDDQPVDDDLQVEVVEKLTVQQNTAASSAHPKKVVLHFSRSARGTFTLSGLPTGKAKIFVSSAASGGLMAGRRGVKVSGNTMQTVHIRLQKRPSQ